jgi:hypothetical protein
MGVYRTPWSEWWTSQVDFRWATAMSKAANRSLVLRWVAIVQPATLRLQTSKHEEAPFGDCPLQCTRSLPGDSGPHGMRADHRTSIPLSVNYKISAPVARPVGRKADDGAPGRGQQQIAARHVAADEISLDAWSWGQRLQIGTMVTSRG